MKDEPLFQDADKEEAMYDPEGSENDRSARDDVPGAGIVVPAAGFATVGGAAGGTGGPTGIAAAGPGIAGAALAGELDDDATDDRSRRDAAAGANDAAGQTPSG